tara:strand:+ start:315 stop:581 length:267 start_codon:yes stop_codon:yes gene_type:complete
MRHVIREIMPNDMPMILQGEVTEKGNILLGSVRVIPLTPCMECDECKAAEMDGEDMPLACARMGEPQSCPNDEQNKKLAIRLHCLLRQ